MSGEGLIPMARATTAAPLLHFHEATAVGQRLHDHWLAMAGDAPMTRDDFGWADLVQRVLIFARDEVDRRESDG